MIRRKYAVVLALVLVLAGAITHPELRAVTPAADPMTVIKTGLDQVVALFNDQQMSLAQRREKLRSMSLQYLDFDSMAKSALGYHWRELTATQRSEFVPLFTEFIQDAYLSKLEEGAVEKIRQAAHTADVRFLKQVYFGPDYAEVFTTVAWQDHKDPLEVNYLMHQSAGQWRVYDVTIESISLIENYRNQFNRIINSRGFAKLIEDLKEKREQLRQYIDQEVSSSGSH
jgi:phospholipid transport system substrate-binding protein